MELTNNTDNVDFNENIEVSDINDVDFEENIFFDDELHQIILEYRYKSSGYTYVYWFIRFVLLYAVYFRSTLWRKLL